MNPPGVGRVNRRKVIASVSDDQLMLMRLARSGETLERTARAKNYNCGRVRHKAKEEGHAA